MTTKVGSSVLSTSLTGLVNVSSTTFTGTTFAGNLNGTWSQLPAGTRLAFHQAAAPTGWTQDSTAGLNDSMLRMVSGVGGGSGGSDSAIENSKSMPAHSHSFSGSFSGNALGNHTHTDAGHSHGMGYRVSDGSSMSYMSRAPDYFDSQAATPNANTNSGNANIQGASAGTPSGSVSGTVGGVGAISWTPKYINMIICSKN